MALTQLSSRCLKSIALCSLIGLLSACGGGGSSGDGAGLVPSSSSVPTSSAAAEASSAAVSSAVQTSSAASLPNPTLSSSSASLSSSIATSSATALSSAASSLTVVPVANSSVGLSSVASSLRSSSQNASSSSNASNSSAAGSANQWTLDATNSYLNFATIKNTHTLEVHNFTRLSGGIANNVASLNIDLTSTNTGIELRDQRMRDLLFQTISFPGAAVTVTLPANLLSGLAAGASTDAAISAELDLHGVKNTIATTVSVQRLSATRVVVQSLAPILIKAPDYALADGVEALRAAVGIASISTAVPVDFTLVFDAAK